MTTTRQSDALKNLVIFMIVLAILGTIITLELYFALNLPLQQVALFHAPTNQPPQYFAIP